ncbi:MAG: type II toxin-antitoxin system HicA family toxin [Candidatus Sulfotelmatobacter sp.]|jgi:predicted RNA binding protein YcfA (HicA-like mRNA interferase family)
MGKRKYPPLKHREVVEIVLALGFVLDRQESSHAQYERAATPGRPRAVVTVDGYEDFEEKIIKRMIAQSGFTPQQFYGATPKTAKKIR